jgi:orotate phosphoribosyltransferase-like protein
MKKNVVIIDDMIIIGDNIITMIINIHKTLLGLEPVACWVIGT